MKLRDKTAIITGGAQGLGASIAEVFSQEGASVVIADVQVELGHSIEKAVKTMGGDALFVSTDVTDEQSWENLINTSRDAYGRIDILVNNAGVRIVQEAMSITEQDWDFTIDINLKGTFFCSQAAASHMINQKFGRIINISSQLSQTGMYNRAHYCASKGGVTNLTKALAIEWAKLGITVNAIGPGPTEPPMVKTMDRNQDEVNKFIQTYSPMGRRLQVEEIVGAAIYLASPSTTGTTGQLLLVDGGWTAW